MLLYADINECDSGVHNCDRNNTLCTNTPGSYECTCIEGWTKLAGDDHCTGNNPCTSVNVDRTDRIRQIVVGMKIKVVS